MILLTARGELNERVEGLNLGAGDYLTKPFYIGEQSRASMRCCGASRAINSACCKPAT